MQRFFISYQINGNLRFCPWYTLAWESRGSDVLENKQYFVLLLMKQEKPLSPLVAGLNQAMSQGGQKDGEGSEV